MQRKAQAGHVTGGRVFGYDNLRTDAGPVVRVVNEHEAAVVRRIFQLSADGNGTRDIVSWNEIASWLRQIDAVRQAA